MNEHLEGETEGLIRSWMRHDEAMLRDYLVAEVEDPRINVQSILTRHFLIEALFGQRFAGLRKHELRFAAVMNWLLELGQKPASREDFPALHHALRQGTDNAEGLEIPQYVTRTFAALPATPDELQVPNYLDTLIEQQSATARQFDPWEECLATFQRIWRQTLPSQPSPRISVLEPACGSANDYRFLDAFGLTRLLDYTGFDLCEKNVRNASAMFPAARFAVGNVFEIDARDLAFDYSFVHDLFEHLSLEGLEVAIAELCRVTHSGICIGFFNMHEGGEHLLRPVGDYHWNLLSFARTSGLFEQGGFAVQTVHIGTFLKWRVACDQTHNKNAYTFLARRTRT